MNMIAYIVLPLSGVLLGALLVWWMGHRERLQQQSLQAELVTLQGRHQEQALQQVRLSERLEQLQKERDALLLLKSLPEQLAARQAEAESLNSRLLALQQEKLELLQERQQLELHGRQQAAQLAELETRLGTAREQMVAEKKLMQEAEQAMAARFENLAQKIFDEKSQKFTEQNKSGLDGLLSPLREQLKDFREKVEGAYNHEARERFALKEQLERLESLNRQISDDASNLARALKGDKKLQGNWGEVILSRVLEESGLRLGHEYETQFATRNEDGDRLLPDVIVRLPENRDIVIDAKVSLVDYERYCTEEDPAEKERALKAHVQALRNHVKRLSEKAYENLPDLRTLDFVFIFMPVEAAFMLAVEHDAQLFREAFDRKIIIVSPTTLLATLRTVESIWRYERQNRNAEEIARQAGALHDKFVGFMETLKSVGDHIGRSQSAYEKAFRQLADGRGNLISSTLRLEKLGAKTRKKLADNLLPEDEGEEEEVDAGE